MGKFHQHLTELSARDTLMAGYYSLTFLFHNMIPPLISLSVDLSLCSLSSYLSF